MPNTPLYQLSEAFGWLIPLAHLGCAVLCLLFLRVSKSLLIASAGFGLIGLASIVWRALIMFQRMQPGFGMGNQSLLPLVSLFQVFANLVGLVGVSLGLFLALSEAHRKLSSPGDTPWIT